jgi:pimeloyl-ACP methyl ester carboxylesterase
MIDVGGHLLRLQCSGRGQPTVILDAGAGDTRHVWSEVQPAIARFTRVCSYDRAGLGGSEPGPLPRTSRRIVEELRILLQQARIDLPVVLVGHSFGGMNTRLYAGLYPDSVTGLVLVDATHENYSERASVLLTRSEKTRRETLKGVLSPATRSELESLGTSGRQLCSAPPLSDIPTIVITAGDRNEPTAMFELWQQLQRDIVAQTKADQHIIAERSGHNVQFDQPELIIEAVRALVASAR